MLKNVILMLNVQNTLYISSTYIKCTYIFIWKEKQKEYAQKLSVASTSMHFQAISLLPIIFVI